MSYLERLGQQWTDTIKIAKASGANELQLQALESLAECEFGYRSDLRLRQECFWKTTVDKDGDVALLFIAPWNLDDTGTPQPGERVIVYIDHLGVLTTKNLRTEEVTMYDPHEEYKRWAAPHSTKIPMIWVLDDRMFTMFTEPSIQHVDEGIWVAETGQVLSPDIACRRLAKMRSVSYYDGPLDGFVDVDGVTHYYQVAHDDDIAGPRVYSLHRLSLWPAIKSIIDHLSWGAELKLNSLLGWPNKRKFKWLRLPRFGTAAFGKLPVIGYSAGIRTKCQE